jgi:hypothetical protein
VGDAEELLGKLQGMIPAEHKKFLEDLLAEHGVDPPSEKAGKALLGWTDVTARPQVEVALKHPIALLANALGPPPADVVEQAHRHGVKVAGLASNARHARKQVEVGVDIIVAQGTEAGGHTGDVSTMVLIPEVVDAVGEDTIVLAAGGIGRGRQMAAGWAAAAILVLGMLLTWGDANPGNTLVDATLDAGRWLATPFRDAFTRTDPEQQLYINWTIAAVVYYVLARALSWMTRS